MKKYVDFKAVSATGTNEGICVDYFVRKNDNLEPQNINIVIATNNPSENAVIRIPYSPVIHEKRRLLKKAMLAHYGCICGVRFENVTLYEYLEKNGLVKYWGYASNFEIVMED